tara:strand:+ start:1742 stop:2125 length:384 start_codon:yes stop_codon:yes gene_type:complete
MYSRVVALNKSGQTLEDKIADAATIFREDRSWNDTKREFSYLSCWEILKEHPKWSFGGDSSMKRKSYDGKDESSSSGQKQGSRPVGRKMAKLEKMEDRSKSEMILATMRMAAASERKATALETLSQS